MDIGMMIWYDFLYLFILQKKKKQECEIRAHSNFTQTDKKKTNNSSISNISYACSDAIKLRNSN